MRPFFLTLLLLINYSVFTQDTLRFMHYNLLNYGNNYGDCNSSNNNVDDKNEYLKVLVDYLNPDVLTVNEIDDGDYYHDHLLDNVFNVNGNTHFKRVNPPNIGYSPIMNEIYYNSEKLKLLSNVAIETNYRDIDLINFLVLDDNANDSIFIHSVVAHLKAGSDPEDEQERASETYKLMNYLQNNNLDGNYVLSGDFNIRAASESSFQNLIAFSNEDIRFYDPINKMGTWHDNLAYASVHTQSSHLSGGCPSGGGMDDRFDFIMTSEEILNGTEHVKYVSGSYSAVGQDGQRLNMSLKNPANNSVPPEILDALFYMSDHLPVIVDFAVGPQIGNISTNAKQLGLRYNNPVSSTLNLSIPGRDFSQLNILLSDLYGKQIYNISGFSKDVHEIHIPVRDLPAGIYILTVKSPDNPPASGKVLICR